MAKTKDIFIQEFKSKPLDWLIRFFTIVILGLATYITIRLIPVYQSINKIVSDVEAMQNNVTELQESSKEHSKILVEVTSLKITIDNVADRLERIDTRLSKHLGI